ncbi:dihydroxyacetone kinase phosphoryl donor subunit DhaM [Lihuaxuella thermophila]|uniref:phosphoenolpyruvate--glycerone phosphotransferase n=1 Tax=Lihuaxuella thermophila TaxID=1173111 RepID=A0A1H8E141_9BACL|nr:dihydroxyacetone kinase phosphoryl donor subunit DhaM [Lihuaxuella thermophila]SEN13202.1 dihydroxyacetone kinase, phosphotransfer subunit [Lihuaxuella thermophila]
MSYVGIVLVSHSVDLVRGLQEILSQVQPQVPVAIAGGTDDGELGTSPFKIKEAIEFANSGKGVIVLFDLGSSLMNAEIALDWLGENERVKIADAPLVEGAYAAVVESGCGSSLDQVLHVAQKVKTWQKIS